MKSMYYLRELLFRIGYSLLTLSCILALLYYYRMILFAWVINFTPILLQNSDFQYTFIYSNPFELIFVYLQLIWGIGLMVWFPFFIFDILGFVRVFIVTREYLHLQVVVYTSIATSVILFILFGNYVLPNFLIFLLSFDQTNDFFTLFFDIRIADYFNFLSIWFYNSWFIVGLICFLISFLLASSHLLLLQFRGVLHFIIFLGLSVCLFVDIFSQVIVYLGIIFFYEAILLILLWCFFFISLIKLHALNIEC